jgi:metallophosphoesterase (TIGR00282 family)
MAPSSLYFKYSGGGPKAPGAEPPARARSRRRRARQETCRPQAGAARRVPPLAFGPAADYSAMMRILFLGDVVGRAGRQAVAGRLPALREEWKLDFIVVNGENATGGAGLSADHARVLLSAGADCVTLGDHAFDQKDMLGFIETEPRVLRPLNYAKTAPGRGARVFDVRGRKILVAQVLGQVFMKRAFDDPFSAIDQVLRSHPLGGLVAASIVDVHCEATSEKMGMGHFCDGRASVVVGTHTHVPTADATILPGGTAYLTDAGMCGDYLSVIGMDKAEPMRRFVTGMAGGRFEPAAGPVTLSGLYVETDDATGKASRAVMVREGGRLEPSVP